MTGRYVSVFVALYVVSSCAPAAMAQQAPAPPEPEEIVLDSDSEKPDRSARAIHQGSPHFEGDVPVYRYPMLSVPAEIAFQGASGVMATGFSVILVPNMFEEQAVDDLFRYITYGAVSGLSSAAVVYGVGYLNGSRSDFMPTLLGGLAGGGLSAVILHVNHHASSQASWRPIAILSTPAIGALVGYHLFSSWRTGQTRTTRSIAASDKEE